MSNTPSLLELVARHIIADDADKPAIEEQIRSIVDTAPPSDEARIRTAVRRILIKIGCPCNLKGYDFLVDAVSIVVADPKKIRNIVKGLYTDIGRPFGDNASRVERCIRGTIEAAFNNVTDDYLYELFGNTVSAEKGRPTTSQFISLVANEVRDGLK